MISESGTIGSTSGTIDLIWRHHHSWFSLSHFWKCFPTKLRDIISKERQPPLQSRRCDRTSLLPKRLKIIDVPIHLSCHFSVWTKHKGTLEPELEILIYMQDQYQSASSSVNLSPTQSYNIKTLFKSDIWIVPQTRITAVGNRGFADTLQN